MSKALKQQWQSIRIELAQTKPGSAHERSVYRKLVLLEASIHPDVLDDWVFNR